MGKNHVSYWMGTTTKKVIRLHVCSLQRRARAS